MGFDSPDLTSLKYVPWPHGEETNKSGISDISILKIIPTSHSNLIFVRQ